MTVGHGAISAHKSGCPHLPKPRSPPLGRIAEQLKVAQRTLVDWNHQGHEQIRTLRAIEWEAL